MCYNGKHFNIRIISMQQYLYSIYAVKGLTLASSIKFVMSNSSTFQSRCDSSVRQNPTRFAVRTERFPVNSNTAGSVHTSCLTFVEVCKSAKRSTESVNVICSDPTTWNQHSIRFRQVSNSLNDLSH